MHMIDVVAFVQQLPTPQSMCMRSIHQYIISILPNIQASIKWKIPFYTHHKDILYLNPLKSGGVDVGFVQGNLLSNEHGLLIASTRKQVRSIFYTNTPNDAQLQVLGEILREAWILDEWLAKQKKGT